MYDYLIIDAVNFAYQCTSETDRLHSNLLPPSAYVKIGKRQVLKNLMKKMLHSLKELELKYLSPEGKVLFLFDNYTSREELKESLVPADKHVSRKKINPYYKSNRKVASFEFYATLDLFHYYLKLKETKYQSARIPHLEADDLLPTAVKVLGHKTKILAVSSDSDWCKILSPNIDILSYIHSQPITTEDFYQERGYFPSEDKIKLEKMLYGDSADNVKAVFTELSKEEKKYVLSKWDNIIDFLYEAQTDNILSRYTIPFKDKEHEIKLAYKMLSTIPVTEEHFKAVWIKGRNALRVPRIIEEAVGSEVLSSSLTEEEGFSFGEIVVPRKMPEDMIYKSNYMSEWKKNGEKI